MRCGLATSLSFGHKEEGRKKEEKKNEETKR